MVEDLLVLKEQSEKLDFYVKSLNLKSCNQVKKCLRNCAVQHCVGQIKHVYQLDIVSEVPVCNLGHSWPRIFRIVIEVGFYQFQIFLSVSFPNVCASLPP